MKKIILIATLIAASVSMLKAQTYIPFPTDNAEWTVINYSYRDAQGESTFPVPTSYQVYRYMVDGQDTLIDSKNYTKLFRKVVAPTAGSYVYYGAVREEEKYVMLLSAPGNTFTCTNAEDTIYNFNVQVADSVYALTLACGRLTSVTAQDSILINGAYAKQRNLGTTYYGTSNNKNDYWIEGVGSVIEPFLRYMPIPTCGCGSRFDLICLKRNNTTVYLNPDYADCDATSKITAIDNVAKTMNLKIYPNPIVNRQVNISYTGSYNAYSVKVTDYMGRTVLIQILKNNITTVQLPDAAQFYFMMILDKDGQVIKTEKVVVP